MSWPTVPIGDLVKIRGGGTPQRSNEAFFRGEIPWVTPKDMKTWEIDDAQIKITREAIEQSAANEVPKDTVLLVVRSGVLKHTAPIAINRRPVAINQDMKSLQCNGRLLPEYLARFLKDAEPTILSWVRATTADNYSIDNIRELPIPLPPLDEQRRIASILDQADDLRRRRREAIDKAGMLPSNLFLELFGDWSRPGFNGRLVALGDKLDFLTSGSRGWAAHYRDSGSLFLRIQNVKRDELDLSDVAYVEPPRTAEAQRTRVQSGDVLLSITADLGRTAVVPGGIGEAYINQHLSILRSSNIEPRYLSAAIASRAGQIAVQAKNREGVKAGLNFDDVRSLKIPDADITLQRTFAVRVAEIDKLKAQHRAHLIQLDTLFASLQHRAFRGEL